MARIFSLSVPFKGKSHTALVSIRQQGCDLVCMVRYLDKELERVLSGDTLVFGLMDGLKQPRHLPNTLAENLVHNTTDAISEYLHTTER